MAASLLIHTSDPARISIRTTGERTVIRVQLKVGLRCACGSRLPPSTEAAPPSSPVPPPEGVPPPKPALTRSLAAPLAPIGTHLAASGANRSEEHTSELQS